MDKNNTKGITTKNILKELLNVILFSFADVISVFIV